MRKVVITLLFLLALTPLASAQKYAITFNVDKPSGTQPDGSPVVDNGAHTMLYIAQYYRDEFIILDSTEVKENGSMRVYAFNGKKKWETGMYALVDNRDAKKALFDFTIDGSQKFTYHLTHDYKVTNPEKDISGSPANVAMHTYLYRFNDAKRRASEIEKKKQSGDPQAIEEADKEMDQLVKEMDAFELPYIQSHQHLLYFRLLDMFRGPDVPESVEDKPYYYRVHYWDGVTLDDHSLVRTPDLFNKMNYYFFGVLYHADMDTICKYADIVLHRIENDTLMMRYFMDYIMPKYYRSTKNVGWDAVWCYLVRKYYLSGKCGWAKESEIANKRQTCEFLEQSLIGAQGAELWMADTNQSPDPKDWISSHRFPTRFVILWFWDPDCHHCQEQTATLKTLYDSLAATGNKLFEVYAIGYESDVNKWKKYVRDHQLPFVNVGGNNVNIDYQEAYNVHGAPTMIILDEHRRIIMNKVLPTQSILPFLHRWEEEHPLY